MNVPALLCLCAALAGLPGCVHPPSGAAQPGGAAEEAVVEPLALDDVAVWRTWVADEGRTFTFRDGRARLEAGRAGTEPWHAQFYVTLSPLQGAVVLTATVRAAVGTPVDGMCQLVAPPYTMSTAPAECAPTPVGATCRVECPSSPAATKVGFEMGRAAGSVEVVDARLRPVHPPRAGPESGVVSDLERGLVVHLPLDEIDPATPEDVSGRHRPGRWNGPVSVVQGRRGLAARVDGGSTVLELSPCVTEVGTFAAWVRPDTWARDQIIFACGDREIGLADGGFSFRVAGATLRTPAGSGQWVHLCATWDHGALALYIDGVASGVGRARGRGTDAAAAFVGGAPGRGFSGAIDEVRVYDRRLSDVEVGALHRSDAVPDAFAQNRRLARGLNLADDLEVLPGSGQPYREVTAADLRIIRAAGFTWVRVPVAWTARTLPDDPNRLDPAALPAVDTLVEAALAADLAVVLDLHAFDTLATEASAADQDRLVAIWGQLAAHYRGLPDAVMFELLNEPHGAVDANRLNPLLARLIQVVRASDPTRTLLIAPPAYASPATLRTLDLPEADRNLIVTIHAYEPVAFSHAGTEPDRPARATWTGEDDAGPIVTRLRMAAAYGADHGRPVNVGEFGTFRDADRGSRLRWNRYVMTAAEALGLSWAVWSYSGGWGIYDAGTGMWDGDLLRSVQPSLAARAQPPAVATPVRVTPTGRAPIIDGALSESTWGEGGEGTVFRPDGWTGDPDRRTEVRLRQDGERLYVAVHAVEPHLAEPGGSAPDVWAAPWFVLLIDLDGDPTAGFGAAARVGEADDFDWIRADRRGRTIGEVHWSRALGLEARGAPTEEGFDLEMSLPLSSLAGSASSTDWRVRFLRTDTLMAWRDYGYPEAGRARLDLPDALEGMVPLEGIPAGRPVAVATGVAPVAASEGARRPVRVGLLPGDVGHRRVADYEGLLRLKFDDELVFQRADALDFGAIRERLDRGHGVTLNLEFATGATVAQDRARSPVLERVAGGDFDVALRAFAEELALDGREIQIRTLHEFNGDWYPWAVLHPSGQNPLATFQAAWRHVVTLFRSAGAHVRFQLNYNARNGDDLATRFAAFYPGDAWVDSIGITTYDGAGTSTFAPEWWESFRAIFDEPYRQVAAVTGRPIAVAELATRTAPGCDKPAWIRQAFEDVATRYPQVDEVDWFLEDKEGDWDLHDAADRAAFREGFMYLKKTRGVR